MRNVPKTCLGQSAVFAQCAPAPDSPYFFRNHDGQARVSETQVREVYEVVDGQWRIASVEAIPAAH
jgi:hypothetical protein